RVSSQATPIRRIFRDRQDHVQSVGTGGASRRRGLRVTPRAGATFELVHHSKEVCMPRSALFLTGLLLGLSTLIAADFPDPVIDSKTQRGKQTAVLAGGCFWCTEVVFQQIEGVEKVVSGYSGGDAATAHYEMVSTGTTGHAEAVQVTFDPQKISYG